MARLSGALVLLSLLIASSFALSVGALFPPKPSEWGLCDKRADYDVVVKNVTINPDPVVSGDEMEIKVPVYTDKEMTEGTVVVSVSFHGITVHSERIDLCEKVQCPIKPGEFVLTNKQVLPGITPPGSYKIKLLFEGEEGDQLACANINFSIVWKRNVEESLQPNQNVQEGSSRGTHLDC